MFSYRTYYDALIAKLIVSAPSRELVIKRAQRAFKEFLIEGITTNLNFYRALLETPEFFKGGLHIKWLEERYEISERVTNFTFRL
jgi:biotin carboxylase